MLHKTNSLTAECQKLIERLDQLDFVDPFSQYYYNEMKAIDTEILRLNARSLSKKTINKKLSVGIYTSNDELDLIIKDM